jgi:pyrimidine-nucleoside phosphorylase
VLDIKTGSGAFMKTEEASFALAKEMVKIGNGAGKKTIAVVSDMDQPLGYAVGNALEVREAIETLRGRGPEDFTLLCKTLGAYMLMAGQKANDFDTAVAKIDEVIENGMALEKFADFIEAQGGDKEWVYNPDKLPKAAIIEEIEAPRSGYVQRIICDEIGMCSLVLGGGRETKESEIDLSVGLVIHKKVGDKVEKGESLATIHANSLEKLEAAKERFLKAYTIDATPIQKKPLIKGIVTK